ncbi:MAG: phosphatase PAP2 family protein [Candidatus Marinimicrobia bacterium]|nr:phosphatase PAP2 family protein [Candidatus Neomarinimicrobiota bacterium]MBT3829307.1 phosphatase PAP2 family protein [Candidatus Neomarinimicrobiota bacterium]MBT6368933.1 phosphatase PAP2 family protein [Candidatus Neomarinimicrobiota bacterium]MBT6930960.1 phosphatase PAP2 family protein [Candidatus Neomarinimicrobiota bacterium]MBT7871714.1 phosphatase PAP2 family protein [Candidatus Neomarinimicrobiota bacterium]
MRGITHLGDEVFYILVLPIAYWCWRKDAAVPLALLLISTLVLNVVLKEYWSILRPNESIRLIEATGFSFPSGHAQAPMVLWGYIAWMTKSYRWPALIIFLIGISRVYLGVHFIQDVIAGWLIGFTTLYLGIQIQKRIEFRKIQFEPIPMALICGFLGVLIPTVFYHELTVKGGGLMAGALSGLFLEKSWGNFRMSTILWKQIAKAIIGMAVAVVLYSGFKFTFPATDLFNWVMFLCIGLWIGLGAPWTFSRLRI